MPSVFLLRRSPLALQKAREALSAAGATDWSEHGSAERLRTGCAALATGSAPDIVACDLRLPDGHAARLAQWLERLPGRPQLLLLTPTADELPLFDALRLGASAYCIDADMGANLALALRKLAAGRATMSPAIARQTLAAFGLGRSSLSDALRLRAAQDLSPVVHGLPRADQHLLSLLAHGLLCAEIGERWVLTVAEVEQRLWRIYPRLHRLAANQPAGGAVSTKLGRPASFS
jgi:DNA-binding NarL/FixJ family response regulator